MLPCMHPLHVPRLCIQVSSQRPQELTYSLEASIFSRLSYTSTQLERPTPLKESKPFQQWCEATPFTIMKIPLGGGQLSAGMANTGRDRTCSHTVLASFVHALFSSVHVMGEPALRMITHKDASIGLHKGHHYKSEHGLLQLHTQ